MIRIALPKGRLGDKVLAQFEAAGYACPEIHTPSRKLVFSTDEVSYFYVKPSDVPIYVERGVADIGVAGSDILMEYEPDVYSLLDLGIGKCRICVAAKAEFEDDYGRPLRVATKFKNVASKYYSSLGRTIDIIKLNGSIELAPILGLSDVIVDIVETGTTLKENGLVVKEEIAPISARLIANKTSYKFNSAQITDLQKKLQEQRKD
ncbi:MAG: ATP phosphoribosyltransferase [Clostridia bacterium]|nr:ATP phosphoribosyltransferase [Clostridia bacterium]MBO7297159.1 ATP phosphoribosyltransferase [Clostridia bacterium]